MPNMPLALQEGMPTLYWLFALLAVVPAASLHRADVLPAVDGLEHLDLGEPDDVGARMVPRRS